MSGSFISFRVGADDAVILEKEYTPTFKVRDIINLGVREFYVKMSVNGETRDPFSARSLTVTYPENHFTEQIMQHSRNMYCKSVAEVEKELAAWDEAAGEEAGPGEILEEEFAKPVV